jgi:hypothetical protein
VTVQTPDQVKYNPTKAVIAVLIAGAVFLHSTISDGLTLSDWAGLAGSLVTATGVYVLPNLKGTTYEYAKGAVAVLGAIFTGLVLALTNGNLSSVELTDIFIAAAGAIVVISVPNKVIAPVAPILAPDPDAL